MITLFPEEVNFKISTIEVSVNYTERGGVLVKIDVILLENFVEQKIYTPIEIHFNNVAELKCITLNFSESNYNEFEIIGKNIQISQYDYWCKYGYHPIPGFYEVYDSIILKENISKYDPQKILQLKHYLIECDDSYIEIIASSYTYKVFNY